MQARHRWRPTATACCQKVSTSSSARVKAAIRSGSTSWSVTWLVWLTLKRPNSRKRLRRITLLELAGSSSVPGVRLGAIVLIATTSAFTAPSAASDWRAPMISAGRVMDNGRLAERRSAVIETVTAKIRDSEFFPVLQRKKSTGSVDVQVFAHVQVAAFSFIIGRAVDAWRVVTVRRNFVSFVSSLESVVYLVKSAKSVRYKTWQMTAPNRRPPNKPAALCCKCHVYTIAAYSEGHFNF